MRVQFRAADVKHVILFVHRITATERASIETVFNDKWDLEVTLTLGNTTLDDLRRYMGDVPNGEMMVETLQPINGYPIENLAGNFQENSWMRLAASIPEARPTLRKHVVSAEDANVKLRELVKLGESVNGIFTPDPEALAKGLITMDPKEEQRAPLLSDTELYSLCDRMGPPEEIGGEVRKWYEAKRASGELIHIPPGSKIVPKGTILHADGRVEIPWLGLGELRVVKTARIVGEGNCSACGAVVADEDDLKPGDFHKCGAKIIA